MHLMNVLAHPVQLGMQKALVKNVLLEPPKDNGCSKCDPIQQLERLQIQPPEHEHQKQHANMQRKSPEKKKTRTASDILAGDFSTVTFEISSLDGSSTCPVRMSKRCRQRGFLSHLAWRWRWGIKASPFLLPKLRHIDALDAMRERSCRRKRRRLECSAEQQNRKH